MTDSCKALKVVVMGVGNTLLQDDGIGVHVTEALRADGQDATARSDLCFEIIDGGTIGAAVIVVDASELGQPPGTVEIFRNEEIDRQLSGKRRTVHEVALADLFAAAAIRGRSPARRALVAIQPACTEWGLEPTTDVRAAIPRAHQAILELAHEWRREALTHA